MPKCTSNPKKPKAVLIFYCPKHCLFAGEALVASVSLNSAKRDFNTHLYQSIMSKLK